MAFSAQNKYIVLGLLIIVASANFTRTGYDILKSSRRLDDLEKDINTLEADKQVLLKDIEYKRSTDYVEEKARNDLNMVKPGEHLVVFSGAGKAIQPDFQKQDSSNVLSAASQYQAPTKKAWNDNLSQWYRLFFDK